MPKFFLAAGNIAKGVALLTGSNAEHINVLRMKIGDKLIVCDGDGTDYHCELTQMGEKEAMAHIFGVEHCPAEPSVKCTLLCGLPKGERADYIVQKAVETGADEIVFFLSQRCVARPEKNAMPKKLERWQRIAEEACKQSGRGKIPRVSALGSFVEAVDRAIKADLPLFMYETGERIPLKAALAGEDYGSVSVITGPEGGFEQYEADIARASGMKLCSMGARILRCETAPIVALTAIMYETGNLQ